MSGFDHSEKPVRTRLSLMEFQLGRIASDLDSEKRTRAESHKMINGKLDKHSQLLAMGVGITITVNIVIGFLVTLKLN